jgi:outer membrane protein OmpA-like peptidoglycan-associated protein
MTALSKIIIGALATTGAAWFLNGPIGLGQKCDAETRIGSLAGSDGASSDGLGGNVSGTGNASAAPTAEAVNACQGAVSKIAGSSAINFGTGGSNVTADSAPVLDHIAAALLDCPGTSIEVAGHTDAQGEAAANEALSQRRAEAVVAELTKRGIPADRLTARGYGEARLLDGNGPENNSRNRRIEFTVSGTDSVTAA